MLYEGDVCIFSDFLDYLVRFEFADIFYCSFTIVNVHGNFGALGRQRSNYVIEDGYELFFAFFFTVGRYYFRDYSEGVIIFAKDTRVTLLRVLCERFMYDVRFFTIGNLAYILRSENCRDEDDFYDCVFQDDYRRFPLGVFRLNV